MKKGNKTVKETFATWIMFISVAAVMFAAIMVAIQNAYSGGESLGEKQSDRNARYEALLED